MTKLKKPTKEELIIRVAELERANQTYILDDQSKREEFAKAFRWFKGRSAYTFSNEEDPILPSWEQVWVKIGFLLSDRSLVDLSTKQERIDEELRALGQAFYRKQKQEEPDPSQVEKAI